MAETASDPRQKAHIDTFGSRPQANLGKSAKQIDEDLQAFKADVLERLETIAKQEGPTGPQGPKGDKGDPGKDGKNAVQEPKAS